MPAVATPVDMQPFDAAALTEILRAEIPLARAMGVEVTACSAAGLRLRVPIEPNLNHKSTAFGGSLYSAAALACWAMLHALLAGRAVRAQIVIHRGEMDYDRPATADFAVECAPPDAPQFDRAVRMLARAGRARLAMRAQVDCGGEVAQFRGSFALLSPDAR